MRIKIDRYLDPLRRFGIGPAHTVPGLVVAPGMAAALDLLTGKAPAI